MKKNIYLRKSQLILFFGLVFMLTPKASGQMTILIVGGNQSMTINDGIADGQLVEVVNTNTSLEYDTGNRLRKITVRTSCPGQSFTLRVFATNVTEGVAQPEVTLINAAPAIDFIRDIRRRQINETCTLQYTASATFEQGNSTEDGDDIHTVTYTIQGQ